MFFGVNYGLKPVAWIVRGCVINYGLKSVAWFVFGCVIKPHIHATGFSQWLMTKFLSAEFIRLFGRANLLVSPIFRSGRCPTLQENSPTEVGAQFLRH